MNAEEAVKILDELHLCAGNDHRRGQLADIATIIEKQADDLAAIEKAFEAALDVDIDYCDDCDPNPWMLRGVGTVNYYPTLADACRAATKGAG